MRKKMRAIALAMVMIVALAAAPVYGADDDTTGVISTASACSPATGVSSVDEDLQIEGLYRPDMLGQVRLKDFAVRAYRPDCFGWNTVIDGWDSAVYWPETSTIYDHKKDGAGAVLLAEAGDTMVLSNGWTTREFVCVDEKPATGATMTFVVLDDNGIAGKKFFKELMIPDPAE